MATSTRETVFAALYKLLLSPNWSSIFSPTGIVNTDGRVMKAWEQVDSTQQPALYLQEGPQKAEQNTAGGSLGQNRWTYEATAWVYFRRDGSAAPATVINKIVDAIDKAVLPNPNRKQDLSAYNNGVPCVTNVRITNVLFDEGTLDPRGGQAIVMVKMELLTSS